MRRIGIVLGILLLASLFTTGVHAAGSPEAKKKRTAYAGTVTQVDPKAKTMVVTMSGTDLAMLFDAGRAKFVSGYKELEEVKVGDGVEVSYEVKSGVTYALLVSKVKKDAGAAKSPNPVKAPHPPHPLPR